MSYSSGFNQNNMDRDVTANSAAIASDALENL